MGSDLRIQIYGFRSMGSDLRIQINGFRSTDSDLRIQIYGFRSTNLGLRVQIYGFTWLKKGGLYGDVNYRPAWCVVPGTSPLRMLGIANDTVPRRCDMVSFGVMMGRGCVCAVPWL